MRNPDQEPMVDKQTPCSLPLHSVTVSNVHTHIYIYTSLYIYIYVFRDVQPSCEPCWDLAEGLLGVHRRSSKQQAEDDKAEEEREEEHGNML